MKKKQFRIETTGINGTDLGIYPGKDEDHAVAGMDLRITEIWVTVTLDADGMGADATEADFDSYCEFVEAHLAERVGFEVEIARAPYGQQGCDPEGEDEEAVEAVEDALRDLWEAWCLETDEEEKSKEEDAILGELAVHPLQIDLLRTGAAAAGDLKMVAICDRASEGDADALRECRRVLEHAAAMGDS